MPHWRIMISEDANIWQWSAIMADNIWLLLGSSRNGRLYWSTINVSHILQML